MTSCLEGVRVLDLSRVLAGPWCTQILADYGAEVLKVERPNEGDETRVAGPPFLRDTQGNETSDAAYYLSANRGKKSVAINLASPEGQQLVRDLAAQSDVLIENFMVGKLAKYGLSYEDLRKVNPRLVYCSITGFGQTGPYADRAGYDFVFQAMGGMMSLTGEPDGSPQKLGVAFADLMTGMYSTTAILAALNHRDRTGQGQHIDMALLDVQVATLANMALNYFVGGNVPRRMGNAHANLVPYQVFECSDGYIVIAAGNNNYFRRLCGALDAPEMADDAQFRTNPDRVRNRETLIPILEGLLGKLTTADATARLDGAGVPAAPINDMGQVFENPQVIARGMRVELDHPKAGKVPLVRNPAIFSETPNRYEVPPPLLAEHTDEVLGGLLGLDEDALAQLAASGAIQRG
jgi:crotonobetainyl-CoA:carnitine CoA-transferase CaiB-like acyl-CoA transferase